MKTNITCTRCGTVTTWTPYCPGCGAYLEFAGDPPWMPEPQIPDDDAEGAGYEAGPLDPTTGATTAATDTPPSAGATTAAADATPSDATKVPLLTRLHPWRLRAAGARGMPRRIQHPSRPTRIGASAERTPGGGSGIEPTSILRPHPHPLPSPPRSQDRTRVTRRIRSPT